MTYRAVPLGDAANAPMALISKQRRKAEALSQAFSPGPLTLRGLPFETGPDPERCFVHLRSNETGALAEIAIDSLAFYLVFAHCLLETQPAEPLGRPVAEFAFVYDDGDRVVHRVRNYFEVATVKLWDSTLLAAVADVADSMSPTLTPGSNGLNGPTGADLSQVTTRRFFLWAWRNPRPEAKIKRLEVRSLGPGYVLGGICAGLSDEFPFPKEGPRSVRVSIDNPGDFDDRDWSVEIDRGYATAPAQLPDSSSDEFLADPLAGFGDQAGERAREAYVEVTAVPSATLAVRFKGEELGSVRWRDVMNRGQARSNGVRVELIDPGRNWVRVRVEDESTGEPIPCRIHFRSPEGVTYQPHGHHARLKLPPNGWQIEPTALLGGDLKLGSITYAYVNGRCEGWLPRGEVLVDVASGFEYEPLRARVQIDRDQRDLTLRLRRWTDMNAKGWYSGDTHVHFLSTAGAHLEARGEGLNVVNLLQSQWGHAFTNCEDFTGEPSVSRDGRTVVYTSQENRQHMLGHLTLLGLKQPVMPWCSDGPVEAELGGTLETTLSDWADRCHAQGGTVIFPHFDGGYHFECELPVLVATGRLDAIELACEPEELRSFGSARHRQYYLFLNSGYRLPIVGGTDKMSADVPVGLYRTYVHIPNSEFSYESWCRNLTAGRTFMSSGPIISFTVDEAMVGDTVRLPETGGTVEISVDARSIFPIQCLQVVERGKVVAESRSESGTRHLHLKEQVRVTTDSWFAARVVPNSSNGSPTLHHRDGWASEIMAHSSPIYVACGAHWGLADGSALQSMVTLAEGGLAYVRELSRQHAAGTVTHHHGEGDHRTYLERPFLRALETLRRELRTQKKR